MPYTKTNQEFKTADKYPEKHQLVVKRLYGSQAGEFYVRTFSTEKELNDYISRHTGAGTGEEVAQRTKLVEYPLEKKDIKGENRLKDFYNWMRETTGTGPETDEEAQYYFEYYKKHGELPSIWEDPYQKDRALKWLDAAMDVAMIWAGPGVAISAVKGAMTAAKIGGSAVVRAETKTALKSAVRTYYNDLRAASKVGASAKVAKSTVKAGFKAWDIDWKTSVAGMYAGMTRKLYEQIKE